MTLRVAAVVTAPQKNRSHSVGSGRDGGMTAVNEPQFTRVRKTLRRPKMLNRNLRIAFAAVLVTAMSACGSSLMGPEEEQVDAPPSLRTACMAGGEVARLAGC